MIYILKELYLANVKHVRKIFSVLLAVIFLIPAAGFYYTRHSCLKTGETQIVFEQDYACCTDSHHTQHDPETSAESACCALPDANLPGFQSEGGDCCSDEVEYIKTDDEYTTPAKPYLPRIEVHVIFASLLFGQSSYPGTRIESSAHSPPTGTPSRDILLQNGVLIV